MMIRIFITLLIICIAFAFYSCQEKGIEISEPLFTELKSDLTGIEFSNPVDDTHEFTPYNTLYIYNGGGVAAGDINNDGLVDLAFTSNQQPAKLYLNQGDFKFTDITIPSGLEIMGPWVTGITMADINSDGFLDIYVCRSGSEDTKEMQNLLFLNNGDLTFTEQGEKLGLNEMGASTQAYFFDYDNDFDLDALIINHPADFKKATDFYFYTHFATDEVNRDKLYENRNGHFIDVTVKAGLDKDVGFGLSANIIDLNEDGHMDIFIANDFFAPDKLYLNNGDKTFTDATFDYFQRLSLFSMGSDFGDFDNNGKYDLLVADMAPHSHSRMNTHRFAFPFEFYQLQHRIFGIDQISRNMLYLNQGEQLNDIGEVHGISRTEWSWSVFIEDLDMDGWKDILISNGLKRDMNDLDFSKQKFNDLEYSKRATFKNAIELIDSMPTSVQRNFIFKNMGGQHFEDKSEAWGMLPTNAQGAALADLDNDGDLDLIFNNTDLKASIFRNNTKNANHSYLHLQLSDSINTYGIGASATVYTNNLPPLSNMIRPSRGFQSSSPNDIHFGFNADCKIDSVVINWPGLRRSVLKSVKTDSSYFISSTSALKMQQLPSSIPLFAKNNTLQFGWSHVEDDFYDFNRDKLSPFLISREGPKVQTQDVNNDGLTDLIVTGTEKSPSAVILQEKSGQFTVHQIGTDSNKVDDVHIICEDLINDNFKELLVMKGGNAHLQGFSGYQPQLYPGLGNGEWGPACKLCLPEITINSSISATADFDKDGDLDVFIGGRSVPAKYGVAPSSRLLLNIDNKMEDSDQNNLFTELGMVTDAQWADIDQNGWDDLVVAREWDAPLVFLNINGVLKTSSSIEQVINSGLWRKINISDIDSDGDLDILAGNLGSNCILKANSKEPLTLVGGDFDKNGSYENLLFHYMNGEERIFQNMDEYCKKMPFFFNRYFTNKDYSVAKIEDLAPQESILLEKRVYELNSGIFYNTDGVLQFEPFPDEVQLSPVNDFFIMDVNEDGFKDVIIVGNNYSNHYLLGNISANPGTLLLGNSDGSFTVADYAETGLNLKGDVRSVDTLSVNGELFMIFGVNNDSLQTYSLRFPTR